MNVLIASGSGSLRRAGTLALDQASRDAIARIPHQGMTCSGRCHPIATHGHAFSCNLQA